MSSVFWTQAPPRTTMDIGQPSPATVGGCWILDIETSSGSTQMWFSTAYPNPGVFWENDPPILSLDALTEEDSDDTAAALQSAVNDLDGVTDSTLTAFTVSGGGPGFTTSFPQDEWQSYTFAITLPTEFSDPGSDSAQLTTRSPADGMLSSGDIDTVTEAVATFINGLDTVTNVDVVQQAVTPATA